MSQRNATQRNATQRDATRRIQCERSLSLFSTCSTARYRATLEPKTHWTSGYATWYTAGGAIRPKIQVFRGHQAARGRTAHTF